MTLVQKKVSGYFTKKTISKKNLDEKPFKCEKPNCGKYFRIKKQLKEHVRLVHVDMKLKCKECSKTFKNERYLKTHMYRTHVDKKLTCKVCGKMFKTEKYLKKHSVRHGEKTIKCYHPGCDYSFFNKEDLDRHTKTHKEPTFPCSEQGCDKVFFKNHYLVRHMATHSDERPFACEFENCNLKFIRKDQLRDHIKRHNGIKNHKCKLCELSFVISSSLTRHMATHSDERPFPCELCNLSFRREDQLNLHMKRHQGIKDHKCTFPDCEFSFVTSGELVRHRITHTPEGQLKKKKHENRAKNFMKNIGYTVDCETTINAKLGQCLKDTNRYFARIDFHVVNCTAAILLVEVDENQHSWYELKCEFSRMVDVQASLAVAGITKPLYWIRYSPNSKYVVDGVHVKCDIKKREEGLKNHLEYLCSDEFVPENYVNIHYMYYNLDSVETGPEIMADQDFPEVLKEFVTWENV